MEEERYEALLEWARREYVVAMATRYKAGRRYALIEAAPRGEAVVTQHKTMADVDFYCSHESHDGGYSPAWLVNLRNMQFWKGIPSVNWERCPPLGLKKVLAGETNAD